MLKISVVTPSYNQATFLERTIRSVHEAGHPNVEHIVIDGGSTDNSVDIIRKYSDRIAYWTSEKDRGQSDAINKGFARCTGDILCWLNSDDTFLPGALRRVADAAERYPSHNFFFGDIQFIDAEDRVGNPQRFAPITAANMLMEGMVCSQPATFWRRSLMDQSGPVDIACQYTMDWDLFCRMAPFARYKYINAFLATYRLHDASKTCTNSQAAGAEMAERRKRYCDQQYPLWQQRLLMPLLKAKRTLYHISRLRFDYLGLALKRRAGKA